MDKALETLKMMVPKAKMIVDKKASEIQALALETDQAAIKSLLDKMMENSAPDKAAQVKTFTVETTPSDSLVNQLKLIAPGGEFSVDKEARRIVAFARPEELDIVTGFMEQLGADGATSASRDVKVFKLEESEPSGVLTILNSMFPRAEIAADAAARTIVARGSDSELKSIEQVVSSLDVPADQAKATLKTFVLRSPGVYSAIVATLASVAPDANVHWNPSTRQLFVLAAEKDQQVVAEAIAGIVQSSQSQQDSIRIHSLNDQQYALLADWQAKNVPEATVRWESDQQRIVVSASGLDQDRIESFVTNLQKLDLGSDKPTVKSHTIERKETYELVNRIIKSVAPKATLHWNERLRRLVVVATPRDHLRIVELIESVQTATPAKPQPTIVAHDITRAKFDLLQPLLRETAPASRVSWDDRLKKMIVIAEPAEQLQIQSLLNSAAGIGDTDSKPTIETYRFPPRLQRRVMLLVENLREEYPDLSVVDEENVGELVVKGRAEAHQQLRQNVDAVVKDFASQPRQRVKVFPLKHSEADPLKELLVELFPDTRIRADSTGNRIMAWGTDETLTNISDVISQTDVEDTRGKQELVGYDVGKTRVSTLAKSLSDRFPEMILNSDYNTNRLMAWGTEKEHEELAKVIQQYR
ncbi:MAG: secretin N-terminal domain-containing protein, partial [Planctomycetota bacterium]